MSVENLTERDVERLLTDPSVDARAETAAKIAAVFDPKKLSKSEREIAERIFDVMVKDAEVRVREALAVNLKENPDIPRDIAMSLARDVDQVALPVLEFSEVLTDADLIEIIEGAGPEKQVAIAGRAQVSEDVSEALVESRDEAVVLRLVSNNGALISESSFQTVVDEFGESENMQDAMVERAQLPITVAERLVTMVSQNLRDRLVTKHELPGELAADLVLSSRERATISLSTESSEDAVEKLVLQLAENGRLTPSIIMRAVCMGDLLFFEAAMAQLVGIPLVNTRKLIHDSGHLGLEGIYQKSGLPPTHFPAVRAAIDVARETEYDGGDNDRERYTRRMIERILTQYGDLGVDMEADDLEYLLAKMKQLPHDQLGA